LLAAHGSSKLIHPWAKKELGLVGSVPFLAPGSTGPGRHSLDPRIQEQAP